MIRIMLCGAADVDVFADEFADVVRELRGEPCFYIDGSAMPQNMKGTSWARNSERSVRSADLCVFVIHKDFGAITWNVEMHEVLDSGRPFLLLVDARTLTLYKSAKDLLSDVNLVSDPNRRALFLALRSAEERQLTAVEFQFPKFGAMLRAQLGSLLKMGLEAIPQLQEATQARDRIAAERAVLTQQIQTLAAEREGITHQLAVARAEAESDSSRRKLMQYKAVGIGAGTSFLAGALATLLTLSALTPPMTSAQPGNVAASEPQQPPPASGLPAPPTLPEVQLVERDCSRGAVIQFASVGGESLTLTKQRAEVLLRDLVYRIRYTKRDDPVFASLGTEYCGVSAAKSDHVYLWTGYYASWNDASKARRELMSSGVCADCFAPK